FGTQERFNHTPHTIRTHADVAIRNDEILGGCRGDHLLHDENLGVGVGGLPGQYDFDSHVGIFRSQFVDNAQSRIRVVAEAEDEFEFRVILEKEALEIAFEKRLKSAQRLEDSDGGLSNCGRLFLTAEPKTPHRLQYEE